MKEIKRILNDMLETFQMQNEDTNNEIQNLEVIIQQSNQAILDKKSEMEDRAIRANEFRLLLVAFGEETQNLSAAIQKLAESERTDNDIKDLRESVGVPEEPEPTADQEAGEERALA